jgi:N-acetyl sugar amidotransferase
MELRRCTKCITPETHETIMFDTKGQCNVCDNIIVKDSLDWTKRKSELGELIEEYRGKYDYDCIVPFSGGKDSAWTLYYLVKHYKVKPLVVRFDHGFLRPNLEENTKKVLKKLGVDFHHFTPNWNVVKKLMLQSFLEKGDFCWHCHTGIFAYPMQVALKYNVPLIFWGEPSAEYTSYYSYDTPEEVDEKKFNRFINLGINAEDMLVRFEGDLDPRDIKPYTYPPLKDLRKLGYRSVCLGSYIPWNVKNQVKILEDELGWQGDEVENVPVQYSYEKIECYMQGVRDYIKFIKRGYTRPTHLASIDIRHNRMDRGDALDLIKEYEGKKPQSLQIFLDFLGITEKEFFDIALSHQVSPWEFDMDTTKFDSKRMKDFDAWFKGDGLSRAEAEDLLNRLNKA